jgi:hypothetical protein
MKRLFHSPVTEGRAPTVRRRAAAVRGFVLGAPQTAHCGDPWNRALFSTTWRLPALLVRAPADTREVDWELLA